MSNPSSRALTVASRHVRVRPCPGYTARQTPCHPEEEPGAYDVDIGLMCVTTRPVTIQQANHYAHQLRYWVATILDMEREGLTEAGTMPPQALPVTEASFVGPPTAEMLAVLREMVWVGEPLVCLAQAGSYPPIFSDTFALTSRPDQGPRTQVLTVPYATVLVMERCGFLRRAKTGRPRQEEDRTLTSYARACVATADASRP